LALDILRLTAGLIILIVAADRLVISAVRIAKILDVSVVIIGAVIVGFGTSVPEFVVSGLAASAGNLDLAMSNVVASNTSNITLVLGVAALIATVGTSRRMMRREGLAMFLSMILLSIVLVDGTMSRWEGVVLSSAMIAVIVLLIRWSREEPEDVDEEVADVEADRSRLSVEVIYGLLALVATVIAGQQLLIGVENLGTELGFSVLVMGLITGVGTSLPELSAAVAGARRRHTDLVVGNVLGSNIFNSLGVAGFAALIGPGSVAEVTALLLVLMLAAAAFAGFFAYSRRVITRTEGFVLVLLFAFYVAASL
jgi:cation:H+ antiporter